MVFHHPPARWLGLHRWGQSHTPHKVWVESVRAFATPRAGLSPLSTFEKCWRFVIQRWELIAHLSIKRRGFISPSQPPFSTVRLNVKDVVQKSVCFG